MSRSEFRCLAIFSSSKKHELSEIELYKAYVALSLNGLDHPGEAPLAPAVRQLIEARRKIRTRNFECAGDLLRQAANQPALEPYYRADVLALQAYIDHCRGDMRSAAAKFMQSADTYAEQYDEHRELFIRINSLICVEGLSSFNAGTLAAFEQAARRGDYPDLVAMIRRGRAHELMILGRFEEALTELTDSIRLYDLDGNPEDRAVAVGMAAISEILLGRPEQAARLTHEIRIRDGRLKTYLDCYAALVAGKEPKLPAGHPLESIPWRGTGYKPDSIPAKIMRVLANGPATRDELIFAVWGPSAQHPSYCSRLHFALTKLKKSGKSKIYFDGERYRAL